MNHWWQVLESSGVILWSSASGRSSSSANTPRRLMHKPGGFLHAQLCGDIAAFWESFDIWIKLQALPLCIVCGGVMGRGANVGEARRINKFGDKGWRCDRTHAAIPRGRGGGGRLNWAPCRQNLPFYCEMLHLHSIFNFHLIPPPAASQSGSAALLCCWLSLYSIFYPSDPRSEEVHSCTAEKCFDCAGKPSHYEYEYVCYTT